MKVPRCILITGAAGLIGSSLTRLAATTFDHVIATDIDSTKLDLIFPKGNDVSPDNVTFKKLDVTDSSSLKQFFDDLAHFDITINSFVHCAYPRSSNWLAPFEHIDDEALDYNLSTQLGSAITFSKYVIAYFHSRSGGDLIHLSSIQGVCAPKFHHYEGTSMTSPIEYSAIKAGIISITKWLAKYCTNKNIRVNCVSPGGVINNQPSSFLSNYRNDCTNLGMLTADHVAHAILFLLKPESYAINGHNLVVDDGWSL